MPAWIHDRAEHLLAKNPNMDKSTAFAIATQQGHKLNKTPKGFGTVEGKKKAKKKYSEPKKSYIKGANPGDLRSPKMSREKKKEAKVLTMKGRERIKAKNFAIPKGNGPGETGKYPIHDRRHAATALTYVKRHGTPAEQAQVYAAVAKKYPGMSARSSVSTVREKAKKAMVNFSSFNDELQKIGLAGGLKLAAMPLPPSMLKRMPGLASKGKKAIGFMPKAHSGAGTLGRNAFKAGVTGKNPMLRQTMLSQI